MASRRDGAGARPKTPRTCSQWRAQFSAAWDKRLAAGLGTPEVATAYRMAHGEADGVGPWVVDVYGRFAVAQSYAEQAPQHEAVVLDALAELGLDGVYLKRRPRQANVVGERERKERAPERALRGADAPEAMVIHEHGVPLEVRLGDGFSTGLFLDQRAQRSTARERAGERALNLFAYTCGFGVFAALGGAHTSNVDLSKRALEWGKRNYALSELDLDEHRFYARDAFEFLARAQKRGEKFDLVVLDPPSYARGARGRFNADRHYVDLCAAALSVTRAGGWLLACSNQQQLSQRAFDRRLQQAVEAAGVRVREHHLQSAGRDYPVAPGGVPHLKTAWISPGSGRNPGAA